MIIRRFMSVFTQDKEKQLTLRFIPKGKALRIEIEDYRVTFPQRIRHIGVALNRKLDETFDQETKRALFLPLIDYWAIDWDYDGNTFKPSFTSIKRGRGKKEKLVEYSASHVYEVSGKYKVAVKVVDMFLNEMMKVFEVEVR